MTLRMLLLPLACCFSLPAIAQVEGADPARLAAQREAIGKLAWMDGRWRGEAVNQGRDGARTIIQTERIGSFLSGTVKVIEGKGFNLDGSPGFNAFAVISYDPDTKDYTFRSYAQGRAGTFKIAPLAAGQGYIWEIPAGPATIRYTATLKGDTWNEVGDRVMPGQAPVRFFEMNLKRLGDTDWPAAGGMTAK